MHIVIPPEIEQIKLAATEQEATPENAIKVPETRPDELHAIAVKLEKVLLKAKPDEEGFIHCKRKGLPTVTIGPASLDRAIILIDTFIKSIIVRGHKISKADGVFQVLADNEAFTIRFYETKDRKSHIPTKKELKKQAEEEAWRSRYPTFYSSDYKFYRTWDHFPSGRLSLPARKSCSVWVSAFRGGTDNKALNDS